MKSVALFRTATNNAYVGKSVRSLVIVSFLAKSVLGERRFLLLSQCNGFLSKALASSSNCGYSLSHLQVHCQAGGRSVHPLSCQSLPNAFIRTVLIMTCPGGGSSSIGAFSVLHIVSFGFLSPQIHLPPFTSSASLARSHDRMQTEHSLLIRDCKNVFKKRFQLLIT